MQFKIMKDRVIGLDSPARNNDGGRFNYAVKVNQMSWTDLTWSQHGLSWLNSVLPLCKHSVIMQ